MTRVDELSWLGTTAAGPPWLLAEIVGTVDLERALGAAGAEGDLVSKAVHDVLLGARIVLVPDGASTIALAEPTTEGRLAASLARFGEGIVGRYVAAPVDLDEVRAIAADAGVVVSRRETGPFGPELLVVTASAAGPHVLLVDARAVPSPR